jgi:MFS family permease
VYILHFHCGNRIASRFSDFWLYELAVWLHTLSQSFVTIFIPVLMLKLGYDLHTVVIFFLVYNTIDAPLNILARRVIRWLGARLTIALAILAVIGFFWIFLRLQSADTWMLLFLAFLIAIYDSFYWVSHFFLFIESGKASKYAGTSTGSMYAVRQFGLLLGPAIGAVILIFFSRQVLIYAVIIGFALSLVPLVALNGFPDRPRGKSLSFKKFFSTWKGKRAFLSSAFYGIHDSVESNLFPLFIFTLFGTIQSVAVIPILLSVSAIGVAVILGRARPKRREMAIILGGILITLMWLVRITFGTPVVYYATVLAVSVCAYFVLVPLDSLIFEYGHKVGDTLSAAMYRNIAYMGANVVLYGTLLVFLDVFQTSFALAASSLVMLTLVNGFSSLFAYLGSR